MLRGDTGLINQAQNAKMETEIAEGKEKLEMMYSEKLAEEKGNRVSLEEYLEYIESQNIPTKQENGRTYAEVDGKIYEIKMENGRIEIEYVEEGHIDDPRIQEIEVIEKTLNSIKIKVEAVRMEGGTYYYYIGTDQDKLEEKGNNQEGEYTFTGLGQGETYYIKVVGKVGDKETEKTIEVMLETIPEASGNIEYEISWNNGEATVTLSTQREYDIEVSKDNISYTKQTVVSGLHNGDTIYARLTNGTYAGESMQIQVIDDTKPKIEISEKEVTTKSIKIKAKATDLESGVQNQTYKYYLSKGDGQNIEEGKNTTGEYTFNNLEHNTAYEIKVEIEDKAGNKGEGNKRITTKLVPRAEEGIKREVKWNSNGTAQISLSTETGFEIQYSKDRNSWTTYNGNITANNGETIYMCLTDGLNKGEDYGLKVEDREGPEVTVERGETTSNSIRVQIQATDKVSGMPEDTRYNYYIKENGEAEYRLIVENQANTEYTFIGLKAQTTYNIKVTTKDIVGNEGQGTVDATTREFTYIEGNIKFGQVNWANKQASVVMTNNTEYEMEYKTGLQEEITPDNNGWTKAQGKTETITGLKDGYRIIARLTDGTNTTGYATLDIEDTKAPEIEVTGNPEDWTKENVILTINAIDNESGLQEQAYSFDGGKTWQAENSKTYKENTAGIVIQVRDEAGNIGTYNTIEITKIDKQGPEIEIETEQTSNKITIKITKAEDKGIGMEEPATYKYYITTKEEELEQIQGEESQETSKEYTELTQNTTYYIKVEAEDKLGTISKIYKTITTGTLNASTEDLQISDPTWENKKAKAVITNNSEYDMEYQIVKNGGIFNQNNNWTKVEKGTTGTEITETQITDLLNGDTIYARLTDGNNTSGIVTKEIKDTKAPEIEVEGNPENWTKENVTLTINATENESGLQTQAYSFDGGKTWQAENSKTYEENTAGIVIQVRDEAGNIGTYNTIEITKIDKQGPEIEIQTSETTTNQSTVTVEKAEDTQSGMPEEKIYSYYIKEGTSTSGEQGFTKIEETQETTYTYKNLKSNTQYTIKVETKDNLGNIGEKTAEITTRNLLYAQGDIMLRKTIWINGKATITLENTVEEYNMQYQIGKNGAGINLSGQWTTVEEKIIEIEGTENQDIIYARLTDNVNVTEGYATVNINNPAKESYTEEELAKETTRTDNEILGISASAKEIKVQINGEEEQEQNEEGKLYNYYYKTINEDEYKLISTNTYYNETAVITEVEEGTIYKIKALVMDKEGKVTRSENTATIIALDEAETNQTYEENRTYIDNSKEIEAIVRETNKTNSINIETTAKTENNINNNESKENINNTVENASTLSTQKIQAGYTISVPAEFKISNEEGETKQEQGTVLKDGKENEYVWIPVNDAIYDGITEYPTGTGNAGTRTYKTMAIKQQGYDNYYESIIYTYNGILSYRNTNNTGIGKTNYREPSLITNNPDDGYTWNITNPKGNAYDVAEENYKTILGFENSQQYGEYMASSYNNMITAVDTYGGFYVGRYETTVDETQTTEDNLAKGENIVIGSKANSKILSTNNWYKLNLFQDSERYEKNPYYNTASVKSSMIWGSQWDGMLNYILKGEDKEKVTIQTGEQKNIQSNSGQDETDKINNIYDIGSNVYEWTQEASATNYRIYRGGSYDSTTKARPDTRTNIIPTEQGPALGSRIGLYVKSTNDVTGPAVKINKTEAKTNAITVEVSATDKETGVSLYRYYLGTKTQGEDGTGESTGESQEIIWQPVKEVNTNTYTFTGLTQETTYYIKVEAVDGAGNTGKAEQTEVKTEKLGEIANTAIKRIQKYGPNGSGILQLELDEEYTKTGYYIEYQVLEEGQTINMSGTWTKGDTINNLSNGQKVYATIYDGINRTTNCYEETIEGLEEYAYIDENGNTYTEEEAIHAPNTTTYDTTITYNDNTNNTNNIATIPAGFKVGITETVKTIENGLVIQDNKGNEYVWIPVEDVIETDTSTTSEEKAMARYQKGEKAERSKKYNEGLLCDFTGTTSKKKNATNVLGTNGYREPSLITGGEDYTWNIITNGAIGAIYDTLEQYYKNMDFGETSGVNAFNSYTEFGQYMNEQYTNMIQSVEKYGGFYVGRYETSLEGTVTNKDAIVQSKIAQTPINDKSWYNDYYYQDSNINEKNPYYNSKSVTSSMIWGSQWDAIMNWMLKDEKTKNFVTEITGNHTDTLTQTGSYTNDLVKNIFDLSSNTAEWTQTTSSNYRRIIRGSTAGNISSIYGRYTASTYNGYGAGPVHTYIAYGKNSNGTDITGKFLGTRMTLYISNTEDTTPPEVEIKETKAGTNNIEITVNAIDNESGISKYKYSLSLKDFRESDFQDTDILSTIETYGNTNVFQGLTQNQPYYIKIEVTNGTGKTQTVYTEKIMTEVLEVQEGAIIQEKVWGKEGEGKAYYEISEETNFENEGYYIQYQIDKGGQTGYQPNGEWTTGQTAQGLSVGDNVYTRIYDGINATPYYLTTNITELETFSEIYEETTKYEDKETKPVEGGEGQEEIVGTVYIPAGFRVSTSSLTNKIVNGLVIEDEQENQYVWIPVENVVWDGKTEIKEDYKPMVKYQSGYNEESTEQYFEGLAYNFSGTTSSRNTSTGLGTNSYREPALITGTNNTSWVYTIGSQYDAVNYNQLSEIGINSATQMGEYLNNKYTEMVESIKKYGGFYVGRYETSLFTEEGTNSTNGTVVKSVIGEQPMANIDWYKMYLSQDSNYEKNPYHASTSVTSSMITGSQWDTMLNYILKGSDKEKVTAITGNHTGTREETGKFGSDIMSNIFDLSSNVREWTTEGYSSMSRITRGGDYGATNVYTASNCDGNSPTRTGSHIGSRLSLYVK